jgi:hypothetical protein
MDINNIKNYLKYENQKKAMMQAIKFGISKQKFFKMKKEAGFTNWTFEKRKYKKELLFSSKKDKYLDKDQDKDQDQDINKYINLEEDKDLDKDIDKDINLEEDNNIIMVEEIEEIKTPYNIWLDIK